MGNQANVTGYPDFNKFEIVKVGSTTVSSGGSPTNWTTVAHNLGYAPQIVAFLNSITVSSGGTTIVSSGDIPLPTYANLTITGGFVQFSTFINAIVDKTNVYFFLFNGTGGAVSALPIKYYLLRERSR